MILAACMMAAAIVILLWSACTCGKLEDEMREGYVRMWSPKKLRPVQYWLDYLVEYLDAPNARYSYLVPPELVAEAKKQGAVEGDGLGTEQPA